MDKKNNIYEAIGKIVFETTVRLVTVYAVGAAIDKLEKSYQKKKALKANDADPSELEKDIVNCKTFANVKSLTNEEKCNIPTDVLKSWQYVEPTDAKDEEDEDLEW